MTSHTCICQTWLFPGIPEAALSIVSSAIGLLDFDTGDLSLKIMIWFYTYITFFLILWNSRYWLVNKDNKEEHCWEPCWREGHFLGIKIYQNYVPGRKGRGCSWPNRWDRCFCIWGPNLPFALVFAQSHVCFSVFSICCFSVLGDQQEDSTTRRSRPVRTYRRTRYYARHKWFLLLLFILDGPTNCQCYQYQVPNQKPLFGLPKTLLLQQWLQKMLSNKLNKEKRFGWLIKEVKLK